MARLADGIHRDAQFTNVTGLDRRGIRRWRMRAARCQSSWCRSSFPKSLRSGRSEIESLTRFHPWPNRRSRLNNEAGLTYVGVQLDASWRGPDDGRPDARAAHAIAVAIANQLRSAVVSPGTEFSKKRDAPLDSNQSQSETRAAQ